MKYAKQIESLVYDKGLMPLAKRTYQNHFWASNQAEILGDHLPGFSHRVPGSATAVLKPGRPVANAGVARTGNLSVQPYTQVTLNGQPSSFAKTFNWTLTTKPAGSTSWIANPSAASPSFTPDIPGNYVFSLVVNNGAVNSAANTTTVTASSTASAPISYASQVFGFVTGAYCGMSCHWEVQAPNVNRNDPAAQNAVYEWVVERINLVDPADSTAMRKNSGDPHGGGSLFLGSSSASTSKRDLLLKWIVEGAPKN
jgi:hypothetical protein